MAIGKKTLRLAHRVAAASPREWQTRAQQVLFAAHNWVASSQGRSALSNRGHLRALKMRSGELGSWWKQRDRRWFIDGQRIANIRRLANSPESDISWIMQQADVVVSGKMPMFSYTPVDFSGADRWHKDFILNQASDRSQFYGMVKYLDANMVGDSKHVWEASRFYWAYWLGIAYQVTSDDKYVAKFFELTEDWFNRNPYPFGINYCSALECAFRNYAWLWSLRLFADQFEHRSDILENVVQGIWIGCNHIEKNLSTYFAPNTHIAGEAFGLFVCGAALPEFDDSKRWRKMGSSILEHEASVQFHEDGTHRELSSGYHVYMTDLYLQAMLVAQETNFQLPRQMYDAARRMSVRLAELAPLDLRLPQFNDCDGGRLTPLVSNSLDAGPSLMAAESLFDDVSLMVKDHPVRGYPLLTCPAPKNSGRTRWHDFQTPFERNLSRVYDSGIATYKTQEGDYLVFRASPFGYQDCPHSHDAGLGIILHFSGVPILVDNGVGSYTQSEEVRNQFRSAIGKNTILVDGQSPSVPEGWFNWTRRTDSELVSFRRFCDGFSARGKHSGFSNDSGRHVFLQREVIMLDVGIVAVVDRWDSNEKIAVESRFTLHPDLICDPEHELLQHSSQSVHVKAVSLSAGENIEMLQNTTPYSADYGQVGETTSIAFCPKPSHRSGIATIFSRVGRVSNLAGRRIGFENEDLVIQLSITDRGVQPIRTDAEPAIAN